MINNLFILVLALFLIIRGATIATKYATLLAESFKLSKYTVGFIIVAIISILPETFISINASIKGIPAFGLGTLLGSNIVDLTLVFATIIFLTGRGLKVESKILKNQVVYPFILLLPIVLGFNGHFSRLEGVSLIITGCVFYYLALRDGSIDRESTKQGDGRVKNLAALLFSMILLLVGSHFTVISAASLAGYFGINPILIGILIVGIGTTLPEFFFSLRSAEEHNDSLAVGDILGTVLADATIVVGIIAVVNPFYFPIKIIYITGMFMVVASFLLFYYMRSGRTLTRREAWYLFIFWLVFVMVECVANI